MEEIDDTLCKTRFVDYTRDVKEKGEALEMFQDL